MRFFAAVQRCENLKYPIVFNHSYLKICWSKYKEMKNI